MFLQIEQVDVRYRGSTRATVQGASLALAAGDIGVLIGPSGCGKTTLLRAVAGLEPIAAGRITLAGQEVSSAQRHLPPEQRRIGMVFQDYALFPHLNVARNVAFGLRHLRAAERHERVAQALALVDLAGCAAQYPHELSGGQQQRVALARALAPRPRLLLLDEPFSNLDVSLRERLAHELRDILKNAGATALFVTHDQLEAFAIGDAIGVMQGGQLHQWDSAPRLYQRPATRFVADFIGHGVFVPAQLQTARPVQDGTAHGQVLHTPLGSLGLAGGATPPSVGAGGRCALLLRADDIAYDPHAPVKAQVTRKAFRGAAFLYTLQLPEGETVMALLPSEHAHEVGDWIGIRPAIKNLVTFAED